MTCMGACANRARRAKRIRVAGPASSTARPKMWPFIEPLRQGRTQMPAESRKFVGDDTEIATAPGLLEYYAVSGKMTRGGEYATMIEALPRDVASLTRI